MKEKELSRVWLLVAIALVSGLGAASVRTRGVDWAPGESAFRRFVGGATPSGRVHARGVVTLPGLPRSRAGELRLELAEPAVVRLQIDDGASSLARTDREGVLVASIPQSDAPGARIVLAPEAGAPPLRLESVQVTAHPGMLRPFLSSFFAAVLGGVLVMGWGDRRLVPSITLGVAGLVMLAWTPALLWLALPDASALARLFTPVLTLVASVVLGRGRRGYWPAMLLAAGFVFGAWVRLYFIASAGSWDTEYWKAWMARAVDAGVTRVYGDADAVPEGGWLDQMRGRDPLWRVEHRGREFVVDYPPLAMALLRASWAVVDGLTDLGLGEKENVAVKLPAVAGDVAAVLLLIGFLRDRPRLGWTLAALYWIHPLSWLSSAVLGFLDGAYAPLAALALVSASRGRALESGALVAVAALVKPQALIVAPAAVVALVSRKVRVSRAVAVGLAVVAGALVPFAIAGTLEEAVAHVFRVLFQQRLSAGYANLWWIVGHFVNRANWATGGGLDEPVAFSRIDSVPFPAGVVGIVLLALSIAWFLKRLPREAALAGAASIFAYAMFAMGVHENHPHAMFLALAATGLVGRRPAIFAAVASTTYVLNLVALSGLGRFYGLRYLAVERLASQLAAMRMALGFDLTLALAVVNVALFAWVASTLRSPPGPSERLDASVR